MIRALRTTWLAWGLWSLAIAMAAFALVLEAVWHARVADTSTGEAVANTVAMLVFATVGALVATYVPGNSLGWLFLAIGFAGGAILPLCEQLANHGLVDQPGSVPGALLAAWVLGWGWFPVAGLIGLIPLLYPTGRVPGPNWRFVLAGLIGLFALVTGLIMLYPGPLDGEESRLPDNPIGVTWIWRVLDPISDAVIAFSFTLLLSAAVVSTIVRFRRSRGDERQQMKWMTFAAACLLFGTVAPPVVGTEPNDLVDALLIVLLPVALGVAILKYRLYDIDRLINKTLVYAALTAVLGGVYFGLVLLAQAVFSSIAGGSDLAIAVSTLAVAALFLPVRSRVQRLVDRRFYRRRYDTGRTLEAFGGRLREHVDLDTFTTELRDVVADTMQPTAVSLWLPTEPKA